MATTTPFDDGDVSSLLAKHAAEVASVRAEVESVLANADGDLLAAKKEYLDVDDQIVLRFVLSAAKRKSTPADVIKHASNNMVTAIRYDADIREDILAARAAGEPQWFKFLPFVVAGTIGDDLLQFCRFGADMNHVMQALNNSPEAVKKAIIIGNEYCYRKCVDHTRKTGRLAKTVTVLDMRGFALSHMNLAFLRASGAASHHNDIARPQLVRRTVVMHAPFAFRAFYSIAAPLMSKATIEKNSMCYAKGNLEGKSAQAECPFLRKLAAAKGLDIDASVLKEFGGQNPIVLRPLGF